MFQNRVTKCICHSRTFEDVKAYAAEQSLTSVGELQAHDICSNSCGLCSPYVQMMLKTGQVEYVPGEPFIINTTKR
jgi:NAD(P)H-nitrite reductase large subunit